MLSFEEKISYFENSLNKTEENYADSFKEDIILFIDVFTRENNLLNFLNDLDSFEEIENWINKLTSRIVLKFDSKCEQINDFIYDYIVLG
jgi:hypothetical protein